MIIMLVMLGKQEYMQFIECPSLKFNSTQRYNYWG
jgi:hypothetical protein